MLTAAMLTAAMLIAGCSNPKTPDKPQTQSMNGLTISMTTQPSPPHTGDNIVIVTITDAAGNPIGDANLTATPNMTAPRLPGPTTSGRAQGMGIYNLPVNLAVATKYALKIHIERIGKPATDAVFVIEAVQ